MVEDPYCPGNDKHALMCRLVNEYRMKHGLKPVQLDGAVTHEAQYWSDQLTLAGFSIMTTTIGTACARDFQVVDFVKTRRAAAQSAVARSLSCANGSIPQATAKTCYRLTGKQSARV